MGTEQILEQFSEYFNINDIFIRIIFLGGIWIVKGLYFLVSQAENLLTEMFVFLDFTTYPAIQEIIQYVIPMGIMFMIIAVTFVGFLIMLGNEKIKIPTVFKNVVIAAIIILLLPTSITLLNQLTKSGAAYVKGDIEEGLAFNVIKENVYDVLYLDKIGYSPDFVTKKNNLTKDVYERMDPSDWGETINTDDYMLNNPEVFNNKLVVTSDGNFEMKELDQKMLTIFKEYYMRYDVNFGIIIGNFLVLILVFVLTSLKMARIIYEIVVNQVLLTLTALVDISTGERVKKVIPELLSGFLAIGLFFLLIRLYIIASSFVGTMDISSLAKMIILIAVSFAVIDGPNLIEKLIGVDAGLKDAWRTAAGVYTAGKALASAPGAVKKGYDKVKNMTKYGSQKVNSLADSAKNAGMKYRPGLKQKLGGGVPSLFEQYQQRKAFDNDPYMQRYKASVEKAAKVKRETAYAKDFNKKLEDNAVYTASAGHSSEKPAVASSEKQLQQATHQVQQASQTGMENPDMAIGKISSINAQNQDNYDVSANKDEGNLEREIGTGSTIESLHSQPSSSSIRDSSEVQENAATAPAPESLHNASAAQQEVQSAAEATTTISRDSRDEVQVESGSYVSTNAFGIQENIETVTQSHEPQTVAASSGVQDSSHVQSNDSGSLASGSGESQDNKSTSETLYSQVSVDKNENVTIGGQVESRSTSDVNVSSNSTATATKKVDSAFSEPKITKSNYATSGSSGNSVSAQQSPQSTLQQTEFKQHIINASPNSLQSDIKESKAVLNNTLEPSYKSLVEQSTKESVKEVVTHKEKNEKTKEIVNRVRTEQQENFLKTVRQREKMTSQEMLDEIRNKR